MPFDSAWLPADLLARAREAVYHSATRCEHAQRQRNPQSGERPVPSARRNSVLAGRLTCCRTPFAHCRKHTLAVGRAAVACSVVVWPGLNLGR